MIKNIRTERLKLRGILPTDGKHLFNIFKEQDASIVTGTTGFKSLNDANQFAAGLSAMNKTGFSYHWVIEDLDDKSVIGFCNIYLPAPHLIHLKNCEVSFGLNSAVRGQGFMNETLTNCLKFIFESEGFQRVEAFISPTNLPSIKLIERLGFQREGLQRKKWRVNETRYDMYSYAILGSDFDLH